MRPQLPNPLPVPPERVMQALRAATWFALSEGDRYASMGRKAVANSFYNLLPMLAEVRKAVLEENAALPPVANAAPEPGAD